MTLVLDIMKTFSYKIDFEKIKWHFKRSVARSGVFEILLALIPLALAGFYFSSILPLQHKQSELAAMLESPHVPARKVVSRDPEEQLASFYGHFQPEKSFFDTLDKLHDIAEKNGIDLPKGDYDYGVDGRLAHYDIVFPVLGNYMNIRKFVLQSLSEIPSLAVTSVGFQRKEIGQTSLDSEIKMTLYARSG